VKVREPREPKLKPRPPRASATVAAMIAAGMASAITKANVLKKARKRFEDIIVESLEPQDWDMRYKLGMCAGKKRRDAQSRCGCQSRQMVEGWLNLRRRSS